MYILRKTQYLQYRPNGSDELPYHLQGAAVLWFKHSRTLARFFIATLKQWKAAPQTERQTKGHSAPLICRLEPSIDELSH